MKTLKKLPAPGISDTKQAAFVDQANEGIDQLNNLIQHYNQAKSNESKLEILLEINQHQIRITNKFPQENITNSPDFHETLQVDLFNELKGEFNKLEISSLSQTSLIQADSAGVNNKEKEINQKFNGLLKNKKGSGKPFFADTSSFETIKSFIQGMAKETNPSGMHKDLIQLKDMIRTRIAEYPNITSDKAKGLRTLVAAINTKLINLEQKHPESRVKQASGKDSFSEFLANMSPDKVAKFAKILSRGKEYDRKDLAQLYATGEPGAKTFKALLNNYSIDFLGGTNSQNFKITHNRTGVERVIKVDNRLNSPKNLEKKLVDSALSDTITTVFADRTTSFVDDKGQPVTRGLLITEFCPGGNLVEHSKKHNSDSDRLKSAASIYKQQAQMLVEMGHNNVAMSDLKNSNGLIDAQGRLKLADTKSLLPTTASGEINKSNKEHEWFGFVSTPYMDPPEIKNKPRDQYFSYNADKYHASMLGKNMYQYISGCSIKDLDRVTDGTKFDFSAPAFATDEGQQCQALIEALVKPAPEQRMSVAIALQTLSELDSKLNPVARQSSEMAAAASSSQEPQHKKSWFSKIIPGRTKPSEVIPGPQADSSVPQSAPHQPPVAQQSDKAKVKIPASDNAEIAQVKKRCQLLVNDIGQLRERQEQPAPDYSAQLGSKNGLEGWKTFETELKKTFRAETDILVAVLKNDCSTIARNIKTLETQQEKQPTNYDTRINSATDLTVLDSLKTELTSKLTMEQLKVDCRALLKEISDSSVGEKDTIMTNFVSRYTREIEQAPDPESLHAIQATLAENKKSACSADVTLIKKTIADYQIGKTGLFAVSKQTKANAIESALAEVPIGLRDKIFGTNQSDDSRVNQVRIELARHRYLGKRGEAPTANGQVVEAKAASTFRRLKDEVTRLKQSGAPVANSEQEDRPDVGQGTKPK